VLPQQLRYRGVLEVLGRHERRAAVGGLHRGVSLGVEQRLHDRGVALESSTHQGGFAAAALLQVDARAALQQHPRSRLVPSNGGRHQERQATALCAARVHAAALVQPSSGGITLLRCLPHG
jgi:hypothetical protein